MRTFVIRARKVSTNWEKIRSGIGAREHFEVVAHSVINAFFVSNGFRQDVEVFLILDSSEDFPRTIRLSGGEGLSLTGFHEDAVLDLVEQALKRGKGMQKDETMDLAPGIQISAYGFEKLVGGLIKSRPVYLLDRKGDDIRTGTVEAEPVFLLSDHLSMPKNSVKSLERRGLKTISLGKKMLFASQCVVILNYELDRSGV